MPLHKRKKSERPMASDHENGEDFISKTPDEILKWILVQCLPNTEEVVRIGFLSRGLRYAWESVPSLDIDCSRVVKHTKTFKKEEFKELVSRVLDNKNHLGEPAINLDSFRLCCAGYYPMSTVCQWIDAAVKRKVKKLDLMVSGNVLPPCLLTCESLESLRLYLYGSHVDLPDCKGFSALKVLELNSVTYSHLEFIEKFLKMCPLLEKLSLIDCKIDDLCYILKIKCPKLKTLIIHKGQSGQTYPVGLWVSCPELVFFECVGLPIKYLYTFDEVESLKTAVILPQSNSDNKFYCKILARISHVESLSLDCSSIRYASDPDGNFPKSFPNLKTLELTTTFETYDMKLLIRILTCSPNLESIHLIIEEVCYGSEYWESDRVETMRILSPRLKRVEFLAFEADKSKLEIAQLLLEHGKALEKMVFSWCNEVDYQEKSTVTLNEVSKFHKASSSVKLVTLLKK